MKPSRIILWSAITTVVGTLLVQKSGKRVPGFNA